MLTALAAAATFIAVVPGVQPYVVGPSSIATIRLSKDTYRNPYRLRHTSDGREFYFLQDDHSGPSACVSLDRTATPGVGDSTIGNVDALIAMSMSNRNDLVPPSWTNGQFPALISVENRMGVQSNTVKIERCGIKCKTRYTKNGTTLKLECHDPHAPKRFSLPGKCPAQPKLYRNSREFKTWKAKPKF